MEGNGMFAVIRGASERLKNTEAELVGVCLREEREFEQAEEHGFLSYVA